MEFNFRVQPREFRVGRTKQIIISDCGSINLEADEQITLVDDNGKEYDIARKSWGYYATPSVNGRLQKFGYKTAIVMNELTNMKFVMIVEEDREVEFRDYCKEERLKVLEWLN